MQALLIQLRSRSLWSLTLLAIGLTTTLIGISPLGISAQTTGAGIFIETAFLGGVAGCSLAVIQLARIQVPLGRTPGFRRLQFELGAIGTATIIAAGGAIAPFIVTSPQQVPVMALACLLTHLAVIGLVFTRLQLRPVTVGLCLPLLVWTVQAFIGPSDPRLLVRLLRTAFDPTQNSTIVGYAESLSTPLLATIVPIIGLLGLRAALDSLGLPPHKQ